MSSGGPELRGSNISLETIMAKTNTTHRQTKIVCTLGPACWDVPTLEDLIDQGLSVARFNFSHGDHEGHKACLDRLREAANNKKKHVGTFIDFSLEMTRRRTFGSSSLHLFRLEKSYLMHFFYSDSFYSCLVGYQGTRNPLWFLCRWRQED